MNKSIIFSIIAALLLSACGTSNRLLKSRDYDYKYEEAKSLFLQGKNNDAIMLLEELITVLKGSSKAEESLYMLAMCYYNSKDYITASQYFTTYYKTYPRGIYSEQARFYSGKSLFKDIPEPKLDQSSTYKAIQELQTFTEFYPQSRYKPQVMDMIFKMHDMLVEKEYLSAKLYFNLGNYMGFNHYQACIITAQNAMKDYPYSKLREELSILILRARYQMADRSVEDKKIERFRETVDEYYAFKNEFPESKYLSEAERYYRSALKVVND